jgi:hypothetical protein
VPLLQSELDDACRSQSETTKKEKNMMRNWMILSWVSVSCVGVAFGEGGPTLEGVIPTDSVQFVRVFSDDSRSGQFLFSNLLIDTPIGRGTLPIVETKKFVYVLQPKHDQDVRVVQFFHGFVNTQGSASAALIIHTGGKTTTVNLQKAIESAKQDGKKSDEQLSQKAQALAKEQGITVRAKTE